MRDLDFMRDDHRAPVAFDDSRKGFKLTDPTFKLAHVELTQREVFTLSIARKVRLLFAREVATYIREFLSCR